MSRNEHTPGPWKVSNLRDIIVDYETLDGDDLVIVKLRNCPRQSIHSVPNRATEDANARLIAAAPELLEALEGLLSEYVAGEHIQNAAAIKARSAITKARGDA